MSEEAAVMDLDDFDPMDNIGDDEPDPEPEGDEEADEGGNVATPEGEAEDEEAETSEEPDEEQEGDEEGDEGEEAEAEDQEPQKVTLKVDGEEKEVTLEEATQLASKAAAADARFREAAEVKKEAEHTQAKFDGLVQELRDNPEEVLRHVGHDLKKMAHKAIMEQIELEKMDPADRRKAELDAREEALKQQEQERQQQTDQERRQQETQQEQQRILSDFNTALQAAELPQTDYTIARMAYHAEALEDAGQQWTAEQVAERVKAEQSSDVETYLKSLSTEKLIEVLGEDKAKELRRAEVEKLKGKQQPKKRGVKARQTVAPKKAEQRIKTLDEIEEEFERRYR